MPADATANGPADADGGYGGAPLAMPAPYVFATTSPVAPLVFATTAGTVDRRQLTQGEADVLFGSRGSGRAEEGGAGAGRGRGAPYGGAAAGGGLGGAMPAGAMPGGGGGAMPFG